MTSWQTLMAIGATHTRRTEEAVQSQLAERQRREAQRRKEIEEKDKKDRELEAKLRLKRLEEQKREQERAERLERERQAKEREMQRRQEQERDALLYGPKKAKDKHGYPVSGAGKRTHSSVSDNDEPGPSNVLTREEKRQRALERELGMGRGSGKRTSGGSAYRKPGRRLPGGAVDSVTTNSASSSQGSPNKAQSTRDRLKAEPAMLIKLNTNKRDTRTIDEIMTDRAKMRQGKVLDGESAKEFNDWFGKAKKDPPKKASAPAASSSTSRANTPAVAGSGSASPRAVFSAPPKSISKSTPASKSSAAASAKVGSASRPPVSKVASAKPAASGSRTPTFPKTSSSISASRSIPKKRRSPSLSASPPPAKRRPAPGGSRHDEDDISSQIWKLFGKDRSSYIERDVVSDDEDMEADVFDVEREELRSTRIAKKEDELALQEEKRREDEKKRKRKEKEKRGNY
ncbi:hypothetical protein LXA43DRAFT_983891 [Ganoderma leucocontextum]|nr:hypothetical protein LXA43DRAFT_983891 [Ganoderma leucocontextum]